MENALSMTIHIWLIAACWVLFAAYWAVSAVGAKRTMGRPYAWRWEWGLRLGVVVLVLLALRIPAVRQAVRTHHLFSLQHDAVMGVVGVVLCVLGLGLAVWARVHLGRNWGMPMSRKENPELVTTGPYAVVRHPIYTGIILAALGSTIGVTLIWALPLIFVGIYFVFSARREEQLMLEQFPGQYPAYQQRTWMLLPLAL